MFYLLGLYVKNTVTQQCALDGKDQLSEYLLRSKVLLLKELINLTCIKEENLTYCAQN
jgi:hypothetical protein